MKIERGVVSYKHPQKNYAFISADDGGVRVFVPPPIAARVSLDVGERVQFVMVRSDRGPEASDIRRVT